VLRIRSSEALLEAWKTLLSPLRGLGLGVPWLKLTSLAYKSPAHCWAGAVRCSWLAPANQPRDSYLRINSVSAGTFSFQALSSLWIANFGFSSLPGLGFLLLLDLARGAWCQLKFCWFYRPSSACYRDQEWQQTSSMTCCMPISERTFSSTSISCLSFGVMTKSSCGRKFTKVVFRCDILVKEDIEIVTCGRLN